MLYPTMSVRSLPGSNERGIMMLELIIVIGIIGIMASLAMMNFGRMNARQQLKEATLELANQLSIARVSAMNRNKTMTVSLSVSGGNVHLTSQDSTNTAVTRDYVFMNKVTQFSGGPVVFNSLGMRTSTTANPQAISLTTYDNQTFSVLVSTNGKITTCMKATCP